MVFCERTLSLGLFSFIYHHLENTCVSVGLNVIIFISLVSYFAATCWLWAQALGGWSNVNTWPLQGRPGTVVDVSILFYSLYVFFHIALVGIKHCWFRTLFSGLDGPLVIWVLNLSCYFAKSVLDYQHLSCWICLIIVYLTEFWLWEYIDLIQCLSSPLLWVPLVDASLFYYISALLV
jgi:hypothetical protein